MGPSQGLPSCFWVFCSDTQVRRLNFEGLGFKSISTGDNKSLHSHLGENETLVVVAS